jgi:hypothetical protein
VFGLESTQLSKPKRVTKGALNSPLGHHTLKGLVHGLRNCLAIARWALSCRNARYLATALLKLEFKRAARVDELYQKSKVVGFRARVEFAACVHCVKLWHMLGGGHWVH